jgi:hypothetical protein
MSGSPQALAAITALVGVLISALVSWIVSRRKSDLDFRIARLGIQSHYADQLCKKRLERYPVLYEAVQRLPQAIQARSASFNLLREVHEEVGVWFSKHSIFLGVRATDILYRYERFLRQLVAKGEAAFINRLNSAESRRALIRRSWEACIALKNDLGVFEVEFARPGIFLPSYEEADELLGTETSKKRRLEQKPSA